uniref:Putative secreted protein n=1 Tax=Anopheles darlingi TaxID=43151 RepID=A0A2M4D1Q6_ANODA
MPNGWRGGGFVWCACPLPAAAATATAKHTIRGGSLLAPGQDLVSESTIEVQEDDEGRPSTWRRWRTSIGWTEPGRSQSIAASEHAPRSRWWFEQWFTFAFPTSRTQSNAVEHARLGAVTWFESALASTLGAEATAALG